MNAGRTLVVSAEVLLGHKLRTLLSSSGVAIGVAAVVLMVGAGQAAQRDALQKVRNMGTNLLVVTAGKFRSVAGRTFQTQSFTTLRPRDARLLQRQVPEVARAAGMIQRRATIRYRDNRTQTQVAGVEPAAFAIRVMRADRGRLLTDLDERSMARVAVLGPTVAANLFAGEGPLDKTLEVNKVFFKVVGVAEARGQDLSGNDLDDVVYVPLSCAMNRLYNMTWIQNILVEAESPEAAEPCKAAVAYALRKSHRLKEGKEDDFTIQDQQQLLQTQRETTQAFTALVGSVAGISLFTGGVGILAVMLISVRERTREIGLRRAIGARKTDVRFQFLLESVILSMLGGLAGVGIGLGGTALTCRIAGWPAAWPWNATLWAVGLSVLMGVCFGLYPAVKASRLDPATALHAA